MKIQIEERNSNVIAYLYMNNLCVVLLDVHFSDAYKTMPLNNNDKKIVKV